MKKTLSSILFSILVAVFCAVSVEGRAQTPCQISCDASMPVCSQEAVTLSVPYNSLYHYSWSPGNYSTHSITVKPLVTTTYHVYVMDADSVAVCDNSFTVEVRPRFQTKTRQLRLTCNNNEEDNGNTAQIKASATGQHGPYSFKWYDEHGRPLPKLNLLDEDPSVAIGLMAFHRYVVEITDTCNCTQKDSIVTRAFPTPNIVIHCEPGDSVYIQNPNVTFSFENLSQDSIAIDHFFWTFEHGQTSTQDEPTFTYVEPKYTSEHYLPTLTVYDDCGCDTTFTHDVYVLPVRLSIPSVFTPNGDGINDKFVIKIKEGSETPGNDRSINAADEKPLNLYYQETELVILNRWGRIVYQSNDYQNDWDGGGLSDGTYFYILKCKGLKEVVQYEGAVMIITKSKQ